MADGEQPPTGGGGLGAQEHREEPDAAAQPVRTTGAQVAALILGAAAVGGLVVWLTLRAGRSPQARVSHRLDDLRHRLDALSEKLARRDGAGRECAGDAEA